MAKAMAKARNSQRALLVAIDWSWAIWTRSKVMPPPDSWAWRTAVAISPTSMKAEPNIVYRKNFIAA